VQSFAPAQKPVSRRFCAPQPVAARRISGEEKRLPGIKLILESFEGVGAMRGVLFYSFVAAVAVFFVPAPDARAQFLHF